VLLTSRLADRLEAEVAAVGLTDLSRFEHHFQALMAVLQRRGMRLDLDYTRRLKDDLGAEEARFSAVAARYGVESINSPKQVADALAGMGETLAERTPSGAVKVDREVLLALADLDRDWQRIGAREPNPLADAVVRAKRAGKWATAYAGAFLDLADATGRLHPGIHALQARTARMSVSRPPLQQLPSSDWRVRRCFVPDHGMTVIAADYSQIEMRVLAALSGDPMMREAIASGTDLHDFTASKVFGDGFTKAQRKVAKGIGFGKVYGGGAVSIARQTGTDPEAVRDAIMAYDATYPGIKSYSRGLQRRAEFGAREVVTPAGRHLPLDRDRLYAATNYIVQSTARDLLAQAVVDCFDAGLGDFLLLPIHDEILAQAPEADAAEVVAEVGHVMESEFYGVRIVADTSVYGPSWGHGYGAKE
jgi:DNA polymerase-1